MSSFVLTPSFVVRNEQTKLLANALDRVSTGVGVGSVYPFWNLSGAGSPDRVLFFLASMYIFMFCAILPHLLPRRVLEGLR